MSRVLLTGNGAAAWGARLARADYVPAFPITPQTEIIETLAAWIDRGDMPGRLVTLESEHSMLTAAGAAAATGVRVFSATSSQGLLYAMEMLYTVAGWRTPFVLVNVSRGLSSPITLEPDHNDVLAARDSGFLQIHCADCQEVLDSVLIAYRLAEDSRVRQPVLVNLDGFYLSFTREPVTVPGPAEVDDFLPAFDPEGHRLSRQRAGEPGGGGAGWRALFLFPLRDPSGLLNGLAVYDEIAAEFADRFGRGHPAVEAYRCDDAEIVLLMMGSFATKARAAVDNLRDAGRRVGLLRPRLLRPFPAEALVAHLAGKRGVAVIDQNISMGKGGVLYASWRRRFTGSGRAGAGQLHRWAWAGATSAPEEFFEMVGVTPPRRESGEAPPPRLLYTEDELREMRKLQTLAQVGTQ